MGRHPVGPLSAALPWIAPATPALIALSEDLPPWERLSADPGLVLLLLRYSRPSPTIRNVLSVAHLDQPILLDAAAAHLEARYPHGWLPPSPLTAKLLEACRGIATYAQYLALSTGYCPGSAAWVTGLLAPLGWLAVSAVDAESAAKPEEFADFSEDPHSRQEQTWGLAHDQIVRRLARRWRLPQWLTDTLGALHQSTDDAVALGADRGLVEVVRAAIHHAENQGIRLGLLGRSSPDDVVELSARLAQESPEVLVNHFQPWSDGENPHENPLLPRLLKTAARARRVQPASNEDASAVDRVHRVIAESRREFETHLRDAKLSAMAEFAAGAGHEINNPLTIISGNAQLLRTQEDEPDRQARLDVIIRQTRRIADLLRDLRQFARPTPPQPIRISLNAMLTEVSQELKSRCESKGIAIEVRLETPSDVLADRRQTKRCLYELLANAVHAAPQDSQVTVTGESHAGQFALVVEDSGNGPTPEILAHMFDPFYSGHEAGRGRGLGLSTSWHFAKQNGGDLRFEKKGSAPTRFLLLLPLATSGSTRQSA